MEILDIKRSETAIGKSYALNLTSTFLNRIGISQFGTSSGALIPNVGTMMKDSTIGASAIDIYIDVCEFSCIKMKV